MEYDVAMMIGIMIIEESELSSVQLEAWQSLGKALLATQIPHACISPTRSLKLEFSPNAQFSYGWRNETLHSVWNQ